MRDQQHHSAGVATIPLEQHARSILPTKRDRTFSDGSSGGDVKPSSSDRDRLKDLLSAVAEGDRRLDGVAAVWVRDCWLRSIEVAHGRKRLNRRLHLTCRYLAYTGALVLPIIAGITAVDPQSPVRIWTFVVSLVVAFATGALQVFKFGQQWRIHEEFAAAMEAEGWSYFQGLASYGGSAHDAYALFFERTEALRRRRGDQFILEVGADVANLEGVDNGSAVPRPADEQPATK